MLPAIFAAISGAVELFGVGKKVYETVTGKPSTATEAEGLKAEVAQLPPEQVEAWTKKMEAEVAQFRAGSDRIKNEQGDVDAATLAVLDPEARKEVAILRMTTRPWVVRKCMHVILMPVYITICDLIFMTINGIYRAWTVQRDVVPFDLFAEKIFDPTSVYFSLYQWSASTAGLIIVNYMIAKTVETVKGAPGSTDTGMLAPLEKIAGAVGTIFKRR